MPDLSRQQLVAKYMEGDVWLSRQSLKELLNHDLAGLASDKYNQEAVKAAAYYVERLIYRLDHLEI